MEQIIKEFINSVRVELADEFDMNFRRKAFFNKKWPKTKHSNNKGSLMMRTGNLRQSISSRVDGNSIRFSSASPYAKLHNEGGEVVVTQRMKSFFWAMYYKASGAVSGRGGQRDANMNAEATKWKALALQKVGSVMKIGKRQFIGYHPHVKKAIETVFKEDFAPKIKQYITKQLKQ